MDISDQEDSAQGLEKWSSLADWTPEQIQQRRRWVEAWKNAGEAMERLRREELRHLDAYRAIELLCGPADYTVPPRAPKPTSGFVEQQYWFMKAAGCDCGYARPPEGA